jgi:hypothetical protein
VAGKGATLAVRIVSDASQASKGFDQAESRVAGFQRGLDRASVAATGMLAGVGALAKAALDASSALQQSTGAVESVFGAQAAAVQKLAENAAEAVGLSKNAYNELGSVLGAQLKNMGYAGAGLVAQTDKLIGVGADLAATFGGTTSDAVSALSSLLRGERDPIERYGIAISAAAVASKVAALGLNTSTDAAKRSADAQATLALVAEQSASAQGAFAREGDTAAGAAQRAAAQFENAKASLGEQLLPVMTTAMTKFSELTTWMTENEATATILVATLGGLAAGVLAVNAAMRIYAAGQALASAAVFVFNAALWANPITWVVLAIAGLVAGVVYAYHKFEWFRNIIQDVWEWLKKAWDFMSGGWVNDAVGAVFGGAPLAATVTHAVAGFGGGTIAGPALYGSAGPAPAPIYGAPLTALTGGRSSAGQGAPAPVVNVTITGALDPVAVGRQVDGVMRRYGRATGTRTTARGGRA